MDAGKIAHNLCDAVGRFNFHLVKCNKVSLLNSIPTSYSYELQLSLMDQDLLPSRGTWVHPLHVVQTLVICIVVYWPLFVFLFFFFYKLCHLSSDYGFWYLQTFLASMASNIFSYKMELNNINDVKSKLHDY